MIWPEAFFRVVKLWSISTRLKDPFQATLMRSPGAMFKRTQRIVIKKCSRNQWSNTLKYAKQAVDP